MIVYARVAIDPDSVPRLVESAAAELADQRGLTHAVADIQSFRPGRPVPTHRM